MGLGELQLGEIQAQPLAPATCPSSAESPPPCCRVTAHRLLRPATKKGHRDQTCQIPDNLPRGRAAGSCALINHLLSPFKRNTRLSLFISMILSICTVSSLMGRWPLCLASKGQGGRQARGRLEEESEGASMSPRDACCMQVLPYAKGSTWDAEEELLCWSLALLSADG